MSKSDGSITAEAWRSAPIPPATVIGCQAMFLIICAVLTALRLHTRWYIQGAMWWDDWTAVGAFVGLVAVVVAIIAMSEHGGGVKIDDVPANQLAIFETAFQACEMTVRISILFARLSVLFLYLRAFFPTGIDRTVSHRVIHLVIWLNVLYSVALILVVTTQCVPAGLPFGSTCINEWLLLVLSSVINIISDFAILIIPLVLVWSLQMSTRKRYAIWALFAFGALAPLASIARLAYQIPTANDPDKTVIYMVVALLAAAEQVVGIVVGCAPVVSSSAIRLVKGQPPASKTSDRQSEIKGFGTLSRKRRFSAAPDPFRITEFSRFGSQEHLELSSITVPDAVADGTRQIET